MSSTEDNEWDELALTPEIQEAASAIIKTLLPPTSKEKYLKTYENFIQWKNERKSKSLSESVFLAYFGELAKKVKPTTLWAIYSMLKCTVLMKHNVDLKQYGTLIYMLKKQSDGYKCKKSKIFTASNIKTFLFEAPDKVYLDHKVILIFGTYGACRCTEITNITIKDVENQDGVINVTLRDSKTEIIRTFAIKDESVEIVQKYIALRPADVKTDRFFLNYNNNKCTKQVIGKNKIARIPKAIATYLKLPNPEYYTVKSFRRSSVTLLADTAIQTSKFNSNNNSDKKMETTGTKCRCCLAQSEHRHNINDGTYMEILKETFNIVPASDARLPQGICSGCVDSLKEAKKFRDTVVAAETQLLRELNSYCDTVPTTQPVVWIKEEPRDSEPDEDECEDSTFPPTQGDRLDAELNTVVPDTSHKGEKRKAIEDETKNRKRLLSAQSSEEGSSESNTPICKIKVELIEVETETGDNTIYKTENDLYSSCTDGNKSETFCGTNKSPTKPDEQDSNPNTFVIVPDVRSLLDNFTPERPTKGEAPDSSATNSKRRLTSATKLRENIILIMQHSTIVPFRHNSNFLNDYICYYCENTYKTMKELTEHTESEHVGNVSDETIMSCMRTRAHKLINADISCIKCRMCHEQVESLESLIEHLVNEHKKVYHDTGKSDSSHGILGFVLASDDLKCHLCHNNFDSFRSLFSHMNDHYEAYICYCCQKKFVNLLRYRTHLKTHIIREVKEFNCDHCGAACKSKTGLVYHMKRHHLNVILKCELCPETFRFKEYRKREEHMVEVHGMKKVDHKYMCDICQNGKVYSSKNTLKIHKSNVHKVGDVLRIECEKCDFVTHHTKRMKEHMDVHNGVKNYGCDLCGKRFTKPYTLRVHMRMHLNDKRYACTLCEAAFVHKNVLQHHMKKKHPDSDVIV